jgi:hypothetical protein
MPEPVAVALLLSWWGRIKAACRWVIDALRLQSRVTTLEGKLAALEKSAPEPSPFRKCPVCGERDLRIQDRYRFRPDVFDQQRYFHEKWRCFSCGHLEQNEIPEPGG